MGTASVQITVYSGTGKPGLPGVSPNKGGSYRKSVDLSPQQGTNLPQVSFRRCLVKTLRMAAILKLVVVLNTSVDAVGVEGLLLLANC